MAKVVLKGCVKKCIKKFALKKWIKKFWVKKVGPYEWLQTRSGKRLTFDSWINSEDDRDNFCKLSRSSDSWLALSWGSGWDSSAVGFAFKVTQSSSATCLKSLSAKCLSTSWRLSALFIVSIFLLVSSSEIMGDSRIFVRFISVSALISCKTEWSLR